MESSKVISLQDCYWIFLHVILSQQIIPLDSVQSIFIHLLRSSLNILVPSFLFSFLLSAENFLSTIKNSRVSSELCPVKYLFSGCAHLKLGEPIFSLHCSASFSFSAVSSVWSLLTLSSSSLPPLPLSLSCLSYLHVRQADLSCDIGNHWQSYTLTWLSKANMKHTNDCARRPRQSIVHWLFKRWKWIDFQLSPIWHLWPEHRYCTCVTSVQLIHDSKKKAIEFRRYECDSKT